MLARLEQVWDAAVASGSAHTMLRVLRFQAEIAGLVKPAWLRPAPAPGQRPAAAACPRESGGRG